MKLVRRVVDGDVWERVMCQRVPHLPTAVECQRECGNAADTNAISVIREGTVIGHLPRKTSRMCTLFIRRGGVIHCRVTGRRYSSNLTQGGLEIPCFLSFEGVAKGIKKVVKLLSHKCSNT